MSDYSNLAPEIRELREKCLELAVRAEPHRAVQCAGEFEAYILGVTASPKAPDPA